MINLWIIVGEGAVGKSTTVRCLTGIRTKRIVCLKKIDGHYFHIFSFIRSIQEAKLGNPERFLDPREFCELLENDFFVGTPEQNSISMSNRGSVANYLVVLRLDPFNGLPGYKEYLKEMLGRGFSVRSLIMFDDHWSAELDGAGIDIGIIHDAHKHSANERADLVRKYWGWI